MDNKLILLAKDYLDKADEMKQLMFQGLGVNTRDELRDFRARMPIGTFYLNRMKHAFTYHGRGCRFESEHMFNVPENERVGKPLNIDMDFGYNDDTWCGIDPWKLYCFVKEYYPDYEKQFDVNVIKREFDLGIKEKIMYKKYDLYYFH